MLWDVTDPEAASYAEHLRSAILASPSAAASRIEADGLLVCDLSGNKDQSKPLVALQRGDGTVFGAVFGTLFERSGITSCKRLTSIDPETAGRLYRSLGSRIVRDLWGSYVSFVRNGDKCAIIVDPAASIPCFYTRKRGVVLAFSHLEECTFLDLGEFSVNFDFVSALLAYDKLQNGETGLIGVKELLAGHQLIVSRSGETLHPVWDPSIVARNRIELPVEEAAVLLKETTTRVVGSWMSRYDDIEVQLSGGLDSAIVLSCLAKAGGRPNVSAIHHVLKSGDQTEVHYARDVAEFCKCELLEAELDPTCSFPEVTEHPPTVRPYRQFTSQAVEAQIGNPAYGAGNAFFTGQGGDHLFFASKSPLVLADHLLTQGFGRESFREWLRAARLSDLSIWKTLGIAVPATFGNGAGRKSTTVFETRKTRITERNNSTLDIGNYAPSWALQNSGLPPAKFLQVRSLAHLIHVRRSLLRRDRRETVHPLVSQPLIELCLQLPTYVLRAEGQSRGLARIAFKGQIPESVRRRRTKGEASRYFVKSIVANKTRIAEALSGGELTERGLISSDDVQNFILRNDHLIQEFGRSMIVYYGIEAWLRTWSRIGSRGAKIRKEHHCAGA
ncbi:MAG TPA: hypothetical protein DCG58_07920 [Hyphomonas adhaerens]|uniref:asparagine synthase (glutamine-hydrolyzing) n=1 Tax=Hyphomonas adhaerens TaxID=81029 RepID=A0A3B9GX99_9PROT|nr:hypothetical protein [Hyphomonas sp.]HAE27071.1 hypothetical protein [Hyphomonas adhaerens]|tara:strand:+ start:10547 stop:12391 length:1845 start_codon:yes stop_codon:yes gene_type:complete